MVKKELLGIWLFVFLGLALHSIGSHTLNHNRSARMQDQNMSVALPIPAQLILTAGDRYLAANINVFRAFMVDNTKPDMVATNTQAKLQTSASFFNPAHEDNYYLAAATLSWQEQVPAAQQVLLAAMKVRPQDIYPGFFYAFNKKYFEHDTIAAAKIIEQIAARASGPNQSAMYAMAARWYEKAEDRSEALNILRAMMEQTRDPALKHFLKQRVQRLTGLLELQVAANQYEQRTGKKLTDLESLVQMGLINAIPTDPTEQGYGIDSQGKPTLLSAKKN